MSAVSIETAMHHLRLEDDTELDLVQGYLAGAEDLAMQYLNRRFYHDREALTSAEENGTAGDRPIVITPSIQIGVLLILTNINENRGDLPGEGIPAAAVRFLEPYRINMGV